MTKDLSQIQKHQAPTLEIRGSLLARNTILNLIGLGVPLLIGVFTIPFIIRWLGTERFGILSLVWIVVGYFSIFDLGLGRATTKFIAEALAKGEMNKIPKFLWTTLTFQGILGLIGGIILAGITPLLVERVLNIPSGIISEVRSSFYLLALSLPIVLVSASFRGVLEAGQRFDLINAVKIPSSAANYLLPLMAGLVGLGLPGIVSLLIISRIITLLAWVLLCLRTFPFLKTRFSFHKEIARPLFTFGGWITVSNVVGPILVYLDRFLIGTLLTIEAISYYTAPYEVVMRLGIIPGSLVMILFPAFSALGGRNEHERTRVLFGRSIKYILVGFGPILVLLIFFAKNIMRLWLGENFAQNSTLVFQILAVGFLVNSLANVPFGFLQGIGRADITAKFHLFELLFYLPLAWILISRWGIVGAAAAWTLRVSVDTLLLFLASSKVGRISFSSLTENGVVRACVVLSAFALAACVVVQISWRVYGFLALTTGFLLAVWFYVFNEIEKTWLALKFQNVIAKRFVL
jgi:O-antigen/teichoic acid export membrane protein